MEFAKRTGCATFVVAMLVEQRLVLALRSGKTRDGQSASLPIWGLPISNAKPCPAGSAPPRSWG
jgi:hypothetical protein